MSLFQAFLWNVGTCHSDVKGASQEVSSFKALSTNAEYKGVVARSSDEVSVMETERRSCIIQLCLRVNRVSSVGAIKYGEVI